MNKVPYILLLSVLIIDYMATKLHILPYSFTYLSELISAMLFIFIILRISQTRSFFLPPGYIVLFTLYLTHLIFGVIINNESPGSIFLGARIYLKLIPFFLLPAVYEFSDKQIASQLKLLLVLALVQFPIAFFQKFIQFKGKYSGDVVRGTLETSSALSILLVSVIVVLLAFYLKKRLSAKTLIAMGLLLFLPTTINETKGTLVLLPFAVFTVLFFSSGGREVKKRIASVMVITALFGFIFAGAYNIFFMADDRQRVGIGEFLTDPDRFIKYLYRGQEFNPDLLIPKKGGAVLATSHVKEHENNTRLDMIAAPFSLLSNQPVKLLFGLGAGNVAPTKRVDLMGEYSYLSKVVGAGETAIGFLTWETGILGLTMFIIFIVMIFNDARRLSKYNISSGVLASGWLAVTVIFTLSLPYKNVLGFNAISFLFWYYSGYIASSYYRIRLQEHNTTNNNEISGYSRIVK